MSAQQQPARRRRSSESYLSSLTNWLQLKRYQYEVTFSLYMLTPTEKIVLNCIIFVLFSLLITATTMYLPNHVMTMYNRIWYYTHGEAGGATQNMSSGTAAEALQSLPKAAMATAEGIRRKVNEL